MREAIEERERRLREFFELPADTRLLKEETRVEAIPEQIAEHLRQFNLEWHVIPSEETVPVDDEYIRRLYPMCSKDFLRPGYHCPSCREALATGHHRHQGRILAVETTRKPHYLPDNRQSYGTLYGFEHTADPFSSYLGRAGFLTSSRYAHNYVSLREFIRVVNEDWRERGLMPEGYRLTICPPAVFNLIGTIFHQEWSETETLELGFYRDQHGNAKCYAVGSNGPGDYSYIHQIETDSDWTLLAFRTVLVPEAMP